MQNILIVVDMQNDFITGALGTKVAQAIVPKVAEKIRGFPGASFSRAIRILKTTSPRRRGICCPCRTA